MTIKENKLNKASLKDLTNHKGWLMLKEELGGELEQIQDAINEIDGWERNKVKYTENDLLKRVRKIYITVLETPEDLISVL